MVNGEWWMVECIRPEGRVRFEFEIMIKLNLRLGALVAGALFLTQTAMAFSNAPVADIDLKKFEGKWYSLTSIPTAMDKDWLETTEYYTLREDGTYDVRATYRKEGKEEEKEVNSRLFPGDDGEEGEMKAQFLWPFKIGYRIIDLPEDYSYVVIGHPKEKYLFIMSRTTSLPDGKMEEIVARCKELGYATDELKSQAHGG
jgi:apolipoprotein D and lipocalin family protein